MCGILLKVANKPLDVPSCIPQPLKPQHNDHQNNNNNNNNNNFNHQQWETLDTNIIQTFLDKGSELKPLTNQQLYKLNNLSHLRELNNQLSKLKNNVKTLSSPDLENQRQQDITQLQSQIDLISRDDETDGLLSDMQQQEQGLDRMIYNISNRGPDYLNFSQFTTTTNNGDEFYFQTFSAILSLRQPFTKQPIFKDQFVLQFNGELYNQECLQINDTQFIIDKLHECLKVCDDRTNAILLTLKSLNGEFAIILIDLLENKIYFGRDSIGKRSLCYELIDSTTDNNSNNNKQITISSVSSEGFIDCENIIYEYNLVNNSLATHKLHELPKYINPGIGLIDETRLVEELYDQLKKSIWKRQDSIHPLIEDNNQESKLAILFSGGLDCTIVANIICQLFIENGTKTPIDLLTVGFENPRTNQKSNDSPDRKLAIKSWFHLNKQFPLINLQLIEINVDYKSWLLHKNRVQKLMYPYNTEMDLSIAIAFYFASSSCLGSIISKTILIDKTIDWETFIQSPDKYITKVENYQSKAKVLFSGLGADELFAGYSRHEAIFNKKENANTSNQNGHLYKELQESLNYDISIIHQRNLSRDDRVISCWGKELRYPYLDQDFINWVIQNIPPELKFKYEYTLFNNKKKKSNNNNKLTFIPTRKYILRQLANYLQMPYVSLELKRAIQFGAKSAKLEIGQNKTKGTDSL
ncbi:asparagine synthase, putative [Candida dubliniensis CD36]|uniref:Asparagine synthase, putative n=1 Tax=Candida dubliniensis (strain CD36 / ATCC MYA-646 / CBS 7987 / NCPF 3949 / NRRL Y-17841) TaxID=573826 RepID=B9WCC2_CANDC|nr:asparagine synthase, putative [Candida dubliniensis CD36]CAX44044.1 asparagine synthase, putative [Candida dubliniensis CD36]